MKNLQSAQKGKITTITAKANRNLIEEKLKNLNLTLVTYEDIAKGFLTIQERKSRIISFLLDHSR